MTGQSAAELFQEWLHFQLGEALEQGRKAITRFHETLVSKGAEGLGSALLKFVDQIEPIFRRAIDMALYECQKAPELRPITASDARKIAQAELNLLRVGLEDALKEVCTSENAKRRLREAMPKLDRHLDFALRQFDGGFLKPGSEGRPLTMTVNTITFHGEASHVAIQQNSPHAGQLTVDVAALHEVLRIVKEELQKLNLNPDDRAAANADMATIEAQASSPKPSRAILQTAWNSLKALGKGVIAAPKFIEGIEAIGRIIGDGTAGS
jgi:hypothetical protein